MLLAWEDPERMHRGLRGAKFSATMLAQVRRRGWAASVAEREPGVASVSAPVRGAGGRVVAAVSVSGPIERLTRSPGRLHAAAVVGAGDKISELIATAERLRARALVPVAPGRRASVAPLTACHMVAANGPAGRRDARERRGP